jgi:hypothetical protein
MDVVHQPSSSDDKVDPIEPSAERSIDAIGRESSVLVNNLPETGDNINLYVGVSSKQQYFVANRRPLDQSTFLAWELHRAGSITIQLTSMDAREVGVVLAWLHRDVSDRHRSIPTYDSEARELWPYHYMLAKSYGIEAWGNAIVDAFANDLLDTGSFCVGDALYILRWSGFGDSPLAKMLTLSLAWHMKNGVGWKKISTSEGSRKLRCQRNLRDRIRHLSKKLRKYREPIRTLGVCEWHVHEHTAVCDKGWDDLTASEPDTVELEATGPEDAIVADNAT